MDLRKNKITSQDTNWVSSLLTKKEILTIPNLLSMFRLVLAVLFLVIHQKYGGMEENKIVLTEILILSGVTDFLDGRIARKYHMISEVGKLLDPLADKVTQGVLLFCFCSEYKLAIAIFLLFLVKEIYMAVMGISTAVKTNANDGAKWYGKINTAVFYFVMALLIIFPDIPENVANLLILCCGCFMVLALVMYARDYHFLLKKAERGN